MSLAFENGSQELQTPALRLIDPDKLASDYMTELFQARARVDATEFRVPTAADQLEQCDGRVGNWLQKWQDTARVQGIAEATLARTLHAQLKIVNEGLKDARDVRVFITIPEGVEAVNKPIMFPPFPIYPKWRNSKGDVWNQIGERMPKFASRRTHDWPPPFARQIAFAGPTWRENDGLVIYEIPGPIRFNRSEPLEHFGLTFKGDSIPIRPIELLYEIHANETPPRRGRLVVRFTASATA